jgi:hypothetical protein
MAKVPTIEDLTQVHGARFEDPPIIMITTGSVENFDLEVIEASRKEVAERVSFYDSHCKPLGENPCEKCNLSACPIADQG